MIWVYIKSWAHRSLNLWAKKARESILEGLALLLDAEST